MFNNKTKKENYFMFLKVKFFCLNIKFNKKKKPLSSPMHVL